MSRLEVTIGRTSSYVTGVSGKLRLRVFALTPTRPSVSTRKRGARRWSAPGSRSRPPPPGGCAPCCKTLAHTLDSCARPLHRRVAALSMTPAPISPPSPAVHDARTDRDAAPEPAARDALRPALCGDARRQRRLVRLRPLRQRRSQELDQLHPTGVPPIAVPGATGLGHGRDGRRVAADRRHDHRFPMARASSPDGSATIAVAGDVTYADAGARHRGVDRRLPDRDRAGGLTGTVYADAAAKPRNIAGNVCTTPTTPYTARSPC